MPRKSCCCNQPPPPTGSCCRPIYNGCVGRKYEFSFLIKIKYPCWKNTQFEQNNFVCPNNPAITHPIQNNFETFRVTVNYRITEPAYQNTLPSPMRIQCADIEPPLPIFNCSDVNGSPAANAFYAPSCKTYGDGEAVSGVFLGNPCNNTLFDWSCASAEFSPSDWTTWPPRGYGNKCNYGCGCFNGKYAKCNFSELRSCDEVCNDGFESGLYRCGNDPEIVYLPGETPECGPDPFGNPRQPTIIREPSEPDYFWPNCYDHWLLQKPHSGFVTTLPYELNCYPQGGNYYYNCTGCYITNPGEVDMSNIPDSYTIQFIPDPSISEQTNPNYTPKIQPKLIHFWVGCHKNGGYIYGGEGQFQTTSTNNQDAYTIGMKMGFGYRAEFCCDSGSGTGPNPNNSDQCNNIEVVDIPFRQFPPNYFSGGAFATHSYQGPVVWMFYGRASLPNDPMNLCVPSSTQNVPNLSCTPYTCESGDAYYDDYNSCYKGLPDVGLSIVDPQDPFNIPNPNLWVYNDYCNGIIVGDIGTGSGIDWPLCNHIKFDYRVDVRRIL